MSRNCAYRVAWSINPHMRVGSTDDVRATRQHRRFIDTLTMLGADVRHVPFVHGAFDSVFMKDSAVLIHDGSTQRALMTHPRFQERAAEQGARAVALRASGFNVEAAPDAPLEGGDVVVRADGHGVFLGHGFRSSPTAATALERFLDAPVTPLELRDPRLYHLDMALSVLADGTMLVCDAAFTSRSLRELERAAGTSDVVHVSLDDAYRFGVNLVQVGDAIVTASPAVRVHAALRARGYDVFTTPLDEFHNAGGSAACLVAAIHGAQATSTAFDQASNG